MPAAEHDLEAQVRALAERAHERQPDARDRSRLADLRRLPARRARTVPLPPLPAPLPDRLALAGVERLYAHQAQALEAAQHGDVVVATGTASGKSLCYQLPIAAQAVRDDDATALYLAPTKALARDQLRALRDLRVPSVRAAALDGDTPPREREAIRSTANVVLTNPDLLHASLLPGHRRWGDFLHRLAYIVVDELHTARGVFGAHIAGVLRRLLRLCARYRSAPVVLAASATIANPAEHLEALTGRPATAITEDGSPRPPTTVAVWEPPLTDEASGARASPLGETAALLSGLVEAGPQTLAFCRSRKGAEVVALQARSHLDGPQGEAIQAYRAGLLAEERREVEQGLIKGSLRGVAATEALELGVDVGALDAVVISGWPGTAASFWQRAGRAGRRDAEALVVFVTDDDPLDRYLAAHPEALWERPLEAATADVTNRHVLDPHVACAAWELPLATDEPSFWPADLPAALLRLAEDGQVRRRSGRWHATSARSPARQVGLRGTGGDPVAIVAADSGELIGEVDPARALRTVHPGAIYLHQGRTWRVRDLVLDDGVALVEPFTGDETTRARTDTDLSVLEVLEQVGWGRCTLALGRVEVTTTVLGYERRRVSREESLGMVDLDLPPQRLATVAQWLTLPEPVLADAGLGPERVAGAAHAAEHAAIALLPLFAMCDRWDIGGVSTPWHPDTDEATIFIYDGYPGGVGIAERGYRTEGRHLQATLEAVEGCPCADGCPSCVQSPKCGNGNEPLDKAGAVRLLATALAERATEAS